jgi:hypothetical protein
MTELEKHFSRRRVLASAKRLLVNPASLAAIGAELSVSECALDIQRARACLSAAMVTVTFAFGRSL